MQKDDTETRSQWHAIIDSTLREIAQVSALKTMFEPVKTYVEETVSKLSMWMGMLVVLQGFLVLLMLGDFIINLRATILINH